MPRQSQLPWSCRAPRSRHRVPSGATVPTYLTVQKAQHRLLDRFWLLKLRQMTRLRDHLHAGASNPFGEFLGIFGSDDTIAVAPHDQGWGRDPMDALLQPAVGHWPNKLAG